MRLGGGRARKEDEIDPGVGITVLKKLGDPVAEDEPVADVRYTDAARLDAAMELLERAWVIGDSAPEPAPLILGEVR